VRSRRPDRRPSVPVVAGVADIIVRDMAKRFEIKQERDAEATPEQVWDAIATGPGQDSWFMGRSEIEPREGGAARWSLGDFTMTGLVTAWDPPRHFANTTPAEPDGTFHQFDYRIDARSPRQSTIRYVHSGALGRPDWEAEYEAMSEGDPMDIQQLVEYVTYFSGRYGVPVNSFGPSVPDREAAMATFRRALGVPDAAREGETARLTPDGLDAIDGVIDYASGDVLGVRTNDALYRFIHSFEGTVMVGHHLFAPGADQAEAEESWRAWLERSFPAAVDGSR
jgi:uncharacterized protein YndB with AHSA1/START domain